MTLPEDFIRYTRDLLGERLFATYMSALDDKPPISVRLNPWKCKGDNLATAEVGSSVPWCHEGIYLKQRPVFIFDPLLHAGTYYVQEASSMFLAHIIRQHVDHPVKVLDLCAAPGGKSITTLTSLPEGSLLFANEPHHTRAHILAENLTKLGNPNVVVTENLPADYHRSHQLFDVIITDAPCSGEGMFRKDADSVGEWSTTHIESCRRLQRSILTEAWHCLQPGGLLIYSTCTLNTKENEDNVIWMEQEHNAIVVPVTTQCDWNITGSLKKDWNGPVYRFIPGITKGEGMFFAVMRKPGEESLPCSLPIGERGKKQRRKEQTFPMKSDVGTIYLQDGDQYTSYQIGNKWAAIPKKWSAALHEAHDLRIMQAGVMLGQWKGKDFIPDPALALSIVLDKSSVPTIEVSYDTAIEYLRKSAQFSLPCDARRGFVLITYQGYPLGWAKHLGNRTNNLYPNEWRILRNRPLTT